jgi:hypothetical protein
MYSAEGKGFFRGLHLLNVGIKIYREFLGDAD